MAYEVESGNIVYKHDEATFFDTQDGYLLLHATSFGNIVATYAPGRWNWVHKAD